MASQGAHEVIVHHDPDATVSGCRNDGAERATGNWLLFLDADDELAPNYIDAMMAAIDREPDRWGCLFTPAVSYQFKGGRGRAEPPKFWPEVSLEHGNWLVLGTVVSRELFFDVGGFQDYGDPVGSNAYEDWALWARCHKAGARIVKVPEAVYMAHWSQNSRHHSGDRRQTVRWHFEIGQDLFPDLYPEQWLVEHLGRAR